MLKNLQYSIAWLTFPILVLCSIPPSLLVKINIGSKNQTIVAELSFEPSYVKTTTRNSGLFASNIDNFNKEKSSSYSSSQENTKTVLRSFSIKSSFGQDDIHLFGKRVKQARFLEPQERIDNQHVHYPVLKHSASICLNPLIISNESSEPVSKLLEEFDEKIITLQARSNNLFASLTPGTLKVPSDSEPISFFTNDETLALQSHKFSVGDSDFSIEAAFLNIDQPSILLPPDIYDAFHNSYSSHKTPMEGYPLISCEDISTLPTFKLHIDRQIFEIPPKSYIFKNQECMILVARATMKHPVVILGLPLFYDRLVSFDYNQSTIHLGHIKMNSPNIVKTIYKPEPLNSSGIFLSSISLLILISTIILFINL